MDYILNVYEPEGVEDASDDPLEILHCIKNTEHITDSAFYLRDYGFRVYTDESNIQEDYIKKMVVCMMRTMNTLIMTDSD